VLTPAHALELADRRQRAGLRDAIAYAQALGEPVGFLCRPGPAGAEFEAVALGSARTCAVVDAAGRLHYVTAGAPRTEVRAERRVARGTRHVVEQALAAAGRPR
jgi:hypothetical protein